MLPLQVLLVVAKMDQVIREIVPRFLWLWVVPLLAEMDQMVREIVWPLLLEAMDKDYLLLNQIIQITDQMDHLLEKLLSFWL